MRTDLIFIKDKAAEIIDDINSLDNIKTAESEVDKDYSSCSSAKERNRRR